MVESRELFYHYQIFIPPQNVNIDDLLDKIKLKSNNTIHLQLIDPIHIVSKKQISIAIYHTLKAFEQKRNIARDPATEFLLRISAKRQISIALKLCGIKETSKYIGQSNERQSQRPR